ncbi:hypothetical protein GW17_00055302 [Ensete ventricosum]|nr:hypothetical protein GW17_00055302 [Ensete ventricosum]RZS12484.1 hypothetical protein BHM03_00043949 [Ensete ventricosum]
MHLLDCDSSPIQSHCTLQGLAMCLLIAHFSRIRTYPFYVEENVLMLHGTEFRSCLGIATNTLSSVYKPLHECRVLRVSNFPHLCELCITLSVVMQHLIICTVSSFAKRPVCLENSQVCCQRRVVARTQPSQSLCATHSSSLACPHGVFAQRVGHSSECQA